MSSPSVVKFWKKLFIWSFLAIRKTVQAQECILLATIIKIFEKNLKKLKKWNKNYLWICCKIFQSYKKIVQNFEICTIVLILIYSLNKIKIAKIIIKFIRNQFEQLFIFSYENYLLIINNLTNTIERKLRKIKNFTIEVILS